MTAALTNKTAVLEQRRALDEELVRQLEAEAHNGAAWAQEALDLRTEVGKMESENVDNLNQLWRDQVGPASAAIHCCYSWLMFIAAISGAVSGAVCFCCCCCDSVIKKRGKKGVESLCRVSLC